MEVFIFALIFCCAILLFAFFSNAIRGRKQKDFDLVPNCLLTRWPLLFVSGTRSIFYYKRYWNLYPVFLAEHGYEVFNLSLPWNNRSTRKKCFKIFLNNQLAGNNQYHLMLDYPSFNEFKDIIEEYSSTTLLSVSVVTDETNESKFSAQAPAFFDKLVRVSANAGRVPLEYKLHRCYLALLQHKYFSSICSLGGNPLNSIENSLILLRRAQQLAEKDCFGK